jgi:hypothetical protein
MEGVGVIQYMILLVATYTCAASGGWHSRHFEEHSASFVWCILRIYLTPPTENDTFTFDTSLSLTQSRSSPTESVSLTSL